MRASALEFRLRFWLHAIVFGLGFTAPWDRLLPAGGPLNSGQSAWLALASVPARNGWMSFSGSTVLLLVVGIVCAAAGAWLRTWGSAYLGASIVKDGAMHGGRIMADGPYRSLRNPLYLGTMLHTLALALLMPPTGAMFAVLAIAVMQARLIGGEEVFLKGSLGSAYAAYCEMVPRIVPRLTPRVAASGRRGRWWQAILGESYMIGVALCFAVFGWRYNAFLLLKCVLIAFGVSLVARAFLPSATGSVAATERPAVDLGR